MGQSYPYQRMLGEVAVTTIAKPAPADVYHDIGHNYGGGLCFCPVALVGVRHNVHRHAGDDDAGASCDAHPPTHSL